MRVLIPTQWPVPDTVRSSTSAPLAFGAVLTVHLDGVRARLIPDLEGRARERLDCAAIGIRYLLPVLSAAGRDDLTLTVLTAPGRHGWRTWFEDGKMTLLESWDIEARSRNHYLLGFDSA